MRGIWHENENIDPLRHHKLVGKQMKLIEVHDVCELENKLLWESSRLGL